MFAKICLFLLGSVIGFAPALAREPAYLEVGCGDLAVIGRIMITGETPIPDAEPLPGWRSEYRLEIRIKQVVRGAERRRIVPATVIAHAQIRSDRDFLIVLKPDGVGGYTLGSASLWRDRPTLGTSCSQEPQNAQF